MTLKRKRDWIWWLLLWSHVTVMIMAGLAVLAAFQSPPTDERPDGFAGIAAPIIALCVALMLALERTNWCARQGRRMRGLFIAIGGAAGALLWLADEAGTHATDWQFWMGFGWVWLLMGAFTFGMIIVALIVTTSHDEAEIEDH